MRNEMIRLALEKGSGHDADSRALATATVDALTALSVELKALVGELAWRALYVRSLHLARSSFMRPAVGDLRSSGDLLAALQQDLLTRSPTEARGAAEALLHALADLLVSLIGEPLIHRLLRKAWGDPAADKFSPEKPR